MNFSDKIKFQREQNHLTQKGLAELVGVSQRAIAAYESSGTIAWFSGAGRHDQFHGSE